MLAMIQPIQVLHTSTLESYLTQIRSAQFFNQTDLKHSFKYLRRAYDNMSLAGILLAILLGLSGIMWGMNQSLVALLLVIGGVFTPILIFRRARTNFHRFQLCHSFTIQSPTALQTVHSNLPTPSPLSVETTSPSLHSLFHNSQSKHRIPQTSHQG